MVKINVDASFDEDSFTGTTGVVIQYNKGRFMAAKKFKIDSLLDVLLAEALALTERLLFAESGSPSDSMNVIAAMQDKVHSAVVAAAILGDCYFLSRDLTRWNLSMKKEKQIL